MRPPAETAAWHAMDLLLHRGIAYMHCLVILQTIQQGRPLVISFFYFEEKKNG